jgi:hypothetical protein
MEPSPLVVLQVPEDHVTSLLAFDGCEIYIDLAGADLRSCKGERDVIAS